MHQKSLKSIFKASTYLICRLRDSGDFFDFKSVIKVLRRLQILEYLRTLCLKFQKARTKIEVVLSLPCWLAQLNWDSQLGRLRTTSILVRAFWNFKCKVLKYSRTCSLHNTLIPNLVKPLNSTYLYFISFTFVAVFHESFQQMSRHGEIFLITTIWTAISKVTIFSN